MTKVKALVLTGYGLNCDYETDFSLRLAGADSHRVHMNDFISGDDGIGSINDYQILVLGGGFSWADEHGAGVLMASKLGRHLGKELNDFINAGKLIIGICNGFQTLVNLGLLPGFDSHYAERRVALVGNDSGNFIDTWVNLKVNTKSPCIFTLGLSRLELPIRHAEGKFYATQGDIHRLFSQNQVVLQYADNDGNEARGQMPYNPNGSLRDIAGICDPTGRILGLMPHPEAFNHETNHPDWTRRKERHLRQGKGFQPGEGEGIAIFRNAVEYVRDSFASA